MKQKDNVVDAMRINGGYATFQQLNTLVDFSAWKTRTPFAFIRRIVQTNREFFRIQPGLWALKECEKEVLEKFGIDAKDKESVQEFTHSYFQGIINERGGPRNNISEI